MQYQFVSKNQTVHAAVLRSDNLVDTSATVYPIHIDQGSSNFLGEDHISCCTADRGADILRKVIFSEYVTFYQINIFFVNTLIFHYQQIVFCGWVKRLRRSDLARGP